jgi:hypothetical protein
LCKGLNKANKEKIPVHGNDIRDAKPDLVIDSMAELKHYL